MVQEMTAIKRGSAKFEMAITSPAQLEAWLVANQNLMCIAFVGRSNVGKSSTINTLFGNKTARVSKTPGRTRAVNIFSFFLEGDEETPYYFFDLPGYGHAEVSKEMGRNWEVLMALLFEKLPASTLLLNIQDARHPNQKVDQDFQQFLKKYNTDTFLLFNKMDKLKKQKDRAALNKLKPALYSEYKWVKEIYFVSAESKQGMDSLEQSIVSKLLLYKESKLIPST
jgi:GTP-binding protein